MSRTSEPDSTFRGSPYEIETTGGDRPLSERAWEWYPGDETLRDEIAKLEAENKRLKKDLAYMDSEWNDVRDDRAKLEAERDRLREEIYDLVRAGRRRRR